MGTSADAVMTDKLGRRSGPRRKYSILEKRAMVEATHVRGASVPEVAHRHGVNANLLSVWRRLYRQGTLVDENRPPPAPLLPVKVSTPTMLPTEHAAVPGGGRKRSDAYIEVEFAGGRRLLLRGPVDRQLLKDLISILSSR